MAEYERGFDPTTGPSRIHAPSLAVFGRHATSGERERLNRFPGMQIEEWDGHGHRVHLARPGRFTARLQAFIEQCNRMAKEA